MDVPVNIQNLRGFHDNLSLWFPLRCQDSHGVIFIDFKERMFEKFARPNIPVPEFLLQNK